MTADDYPCERCGHSFGRHQLVSTKADPFQGGVLLCPEPDCDCLGTWDVPSFSSRQDVEVPSDEELARLRERVRELATREEEG